MNRTILSIDNAMRFFGEELDQYEKGVKMPGRMMVHLDRVGKSEFFVGTLTAYNNGGLKSEDAIPFKTYIRLVNGIEEVLRNHQSDHGFTGMLVGWNPTSEVKKFLLDKKVHRLFFLHEDDVLPFIEEYSEYNEHNGNAEIVITFG